MRKKFLCTYISWLSHTNTNTTFLSKPLFSHASAEVRGKKYARKRVCLYQGSNSQMSLTRLLLSHPCRALILTSLDSASSKLNQYLCQMCEPMKNPKSCSQESNSGPYDHKAHALLHNHVKNTVVLAIGSNCYYKVLQETTPSSMAASQFNPFPNKPWFLRVCCESLLKTLWEKEKLLLMSNFSFSHSVFYLYGKLSAIFAQFEIVICKFFQFGRVKKLSFGKGLNTLPNNCVGENSL